MTVIFVISMVLIPFAIINMREGLENLDGERIEMAESFTRSRWRRFCLIVLPSLTPFIFRNNPHQLRRRMEGGTDG